jgi:signal transduction histidine kinase/ligand-binding sensor domain-containing protein/ActR/RegA family two-component response regulator
LAAARDGWANLATPIFQNITHDSGLSAAAEPTSFASDGDGFMWAGTQSGLLRWDGYHFRRYVTDPKQPGSLPDNYVVTLHADTHGRLWVGTNVAGLVEYDRARDTFVRPGDLERLRGATINAIVSDGGEGLWVTSDQGLNHLDPSTGRLKATPLPAAGPKEAQTPYVDTALTDRSGTLWVGTPDGLLRRPRGGVFTPVALPHAGHEAVEVASLFQDSRGRIWIGTQHQGAFMIAPGGDAAVALRETETTRSTLSTETILTIIEGIPGQIWLGSQGHGLLIVDADSLATHWIRRDISVTASLSDNTVLNLHRDPAGLIWVATNRAIDVYNPAESGVMTVFGPSSRPHALSDGDIESIGVMPDKRVWLGLGADGLDVVDPATGQATHLAPDPAHPDRTPPPAIISAITAGPKGEVLIGAVSGLYRADPVTMRVTRMPARPGSYDRVRALQFQDGFLWVGEQGLTRLRLGRDGRPVGAPEHLEHELPDARVSAFAPERDGTMWVGTHNGLVRVDQRMRLVEHVAPTRDGLGLSPGGVTTLVIDRMDHLWIGSTGGGIDIITGRDAAGHPRFRHIGQDQGLPDPNVDKMLVGPDGMIWVSTDDGLARIDPQSLKVTPLQRRAGVYLTSYWNGSGAVTADGEILFGGVGGLIVVRPGAFRPWRYDPPVVITSAERGGKVLTPAAFDPRDAAKALSIGPEANSFRFEFAALDYSGPSFNRYAYQLVGYDKHWIETDATHRIAAYTNLWPGHYRLRLRGANREGDWSKTTLEIPIDVAPHWYQTPWFYLAAILISGLSVALFVGWRTAGLRRQSRDLEREVAERTAELREQTELALAASRAKSAFLAMMSHELRTPMNGVLGMAKALKMTALSPEQDRQLDMIVRSGDSLMTILNDILDISKIEAGKLDLEVITFDLIELGQSAHDLWADAAANKGVKLVYDVDPATPRWVRGDSTRVRQIVLNLISNALKFTQAGEVRLAIAPVAEGVQISVRDTGVGISPAQQAKLFQSFSQADVSTARRFGGTGLGLSICKQLAELMGGGIRCESAEGQGSTFIVVLALPETEAPRVSTNDDTTADGEAGAAPLAGVNLLVVDDNPINLAVAGAILGAFGATITTAADGMEGLQRLTQADFDVVLMDLQMPRMNGAEALARIRGGAAGRPDIPVIALTAGVMAGETARLLDLGFDDVQPKPINPRELVISISEVMSADRDAHRHGARGAP